MYWLSNLFRIVLDYSWDISIFSISQRFSELDGVQHIENFWNHTAAEVRIIADYLMKDHFWYDINLGEYEEWEEYKGNLL